MVLRVFSKFFLLCVCRKASLRTAQAAEWAVITSSARTACLPARAAPPCCATGDGTPSCSSDAGPRLLRSAPTSSSPAGVLEGLLLPVLMIRGIRAAHGLCGGRRRVRRKKASAKAAAAAAAAGSSSSGSGEGARALPALPRPRSALVAFQLSTAEGAAEYGEWLGLLKSRLAARVGSRECAHAHTRAS
ncbi:hypothetical protein FOA52_000100 [Chlamydomonas sp. UWO 241]|nr:hypothetical protein FOA52_000100 [Chlamydomonas sp. UWO 241]